MRSFYKRNHHFSEMKTDPAQEATTCKLTLAPDDPDLLIASFMISRASGTQLPHCVPQPVLKPRSRRLFTPSPTALRIAVSVTA